MYLLPSRPRRLHQFGITQLLDTVVIVYLDDILIFSQDEEEHVKAVLERLRQHNLYAKCPNIPFSGRNYFFKDT